MSAGYSDVKRGDLHYGVFSERGMLWTCTIRRTKRASIDAWKRENHMAMPGARGWRYWANAGYRCKPIKIYLVKP